MSYELLELLVLVKDDVFHVAELNLLLHTLFHRGYLVPDFLALCGSVSLCFKRLDVKFLFFNLF